MYYRHNLDIVHPNRCDEHMITVKKVRDNHFDENRTYYNRSFGYKFLRGILSAGLYVVGYLLVTIRYGLKIYGRCEFKKNKKYFKDGAITICNHVLMWDYLCVLKAIRPNLENHVGWKTNFEGPNGPFVRWGGVIPIPTGNIRAMDKFRSAIGDALKDGKWLHFFSEGSMWFYYPDIRPFKKAIFKYAVRYDKPVISMSISFRSRTGLWKLLGKKPLADLHIGTPISPDKSLFIVFLSCVFIIL